MTNFDPLYDRVVVRPDPEETTYKGIIFYPDSSKKKPQMGTVVGIGCGKFDDSFPGGFRPLTVRKGCRVLYGKYTGTEIRLNDEDLVIMREEDILGIVTEP